MYRNCFQSPTLLSSIIIKTKIKYHRESARETISSVQKFALGTIEIPEKSVKSVQS